MLDLNQKLAQVLAAAQADLQTGTSERDTSAAGGLAAIFRDCGWSSGGVTRSAAGKVADWCGMSVGAWAARAGMHPAHRSSFFHTFNVEDFFRYGLPSCRNPRRLMALALLNVLGAGAIVAPVTNGWREVRKWHDAYQARRSWLGEHELRSGDAHAIDLKPGDVVLIDYQGPADKADDERSDVADHVTMVHAFVGGVLTVINGNASGLDKDGKHVTDAVCLTRHDLNVPEARRRLYGRGRFSALDFEPAVVYTSLADAK